MTFKKAQKLLQKDTSEMNFEQLQAYKVQLLDAWRYAKGEYGYNNDFFVYIGELTAYVPRCYWLRENIELKMDILGI